MFKNLMDNLTKPQKIGLLVLTQAIVIITLVLLVRSFTGEKHHVEIEKGSLDGTNMPEQAQDFVEENIWLVIKNKVAGATESDVDDVVVREGTYQETVNDDGSVIVSFIVDIDSLKQTYTVNTGWSKDGSVVYETVVDCPPISEMKYPETVCHGTFYDTDSLDLYLPYAIYPDGFESENEDEEEPIAPNYYIYGDEDAKTLEIMVSACDAERFKQEAWEYLGTIPVDFSDYTVEYEINEVNVRC